MMSKKHLRRKDFWNNDYYDSNSKNILTNIPLDAVWKCEGHCYYGAECDGFVWKNNACIFYKNTKCGYEESERNSFCYTKPSESKYLLYYLKANTLSIPVSITFT